MYAMAELGQGSGRSVVIFHQASAAMAESTNVDLNFTHPLGTA
jgi:hypothetical protein